MAASYSVISPDVYPGTGTNANPVFRNAALVITGSILTRLPRAGPTHDRGVFPGRLVLTDKDGDGLPDS